MTDQNPYDVVEPDGAPPQTDNSAKEEDTELTSEELQTLLGGA